jgi:outer membrane scaffolding protein for murein synthesis (MipA/OmpV family)
MQLRKLAARALAVALAAAAITPAHADDRPRRTRVTLGPQVYPSFPGSDSFGVGPLVAVDRARGDDPFPFEAADESFDIALANSHGFAFGPVVNWEGARSASDVGAALPKVKFSIEPGAFASYQPSGNFRLRGELRKGVTGHKGWIATAGADFIARDGDAWLFSIGPRVTWTDARYQNAWFGVAPADAGPSGLPAYHADGGLQAVGATASFLTQLTDRWGIYTYAKYDRLIGDPARSPIVRRLGSRDQFSGGVGLSYTFGRQPAG